MSAPIRVLELRSVFGTGGGPEKTILLGAARTDRSRFEITICYLRDQRDTVFGIDAKAATLNVDYLELRERHSFDPSVWGALRRLVRERRIDIVHAHEYKTDFLAWLLAKFEPVIPLATVHGWTGHSTREHRLYYPADKWVLARYPRLVAVSSDIQRELIRTGSRAERVTLVPNGIDHRAFQRDRAKEPIMRVRLGLTPDDLVIAGVGRLEPQKRFDLLIDAAAQLRPSWPRLKVLIVGDGSLRQQLGDQIQRLGLQEMCILLGHRTDVVDLHHAFDLFIQSSDYEGTSNAVLEAMALETPLVATDAGGTSDIVRDGIDGTIVAMGDARLQAEAIAAILQDRPAAQARATSARRQVETVLSFETRMTAVEAIYSELVQQRRSGRAEQTVAARA